MLLAVNKFGNESCKFRPFPLIVRAVVIFTICVVKVLKAPLFVISKAPTVIKSIPLRVVRPVSVMRTSVAFVTVLVKVNDCRLGTVMKVMPPTDFRDWNDREDKIVKSFKNIVPPMALTESPLRSVMLTAPSATRLPEICCKLPKSIGPRTDGAMAIEPVNFVHAVPRLVASIAFWMVFVAVAVQADD